MIFCFVWASKIRSTSDQDDDEEGDSNLSNMSIATRSDSSIDATIKKIGKNGEVIVTEFQTLKGEAVELFTLNPKRYKRRPENFVFDEAIIWISV